MTKGSDLRPVRRALVSRSRFGADKHYVVELREELILIRPKGCRRGGKAEVAVYPGGVYDRALMVRADLERREKKKSSRRG